MNDNPYAELEQKYANNLNQQNDFLNQSEQVQNQQIDENRQFTIDNIERQKGYAQKDYEKEARGAYQDYQKLVNPYGVQAENVFSSGLGNSGYSETSKLNAYNAYQNRYASARQSMDRMTDEFNNQINQAMLEANQEKAQVALTKLQTQMTNMWNQLNLDSTLAQNKVSYNQWLKEFEYQKQQDEIANAFAREQFEYQKQQDAISNSYRNYYGSSGGGSTGEPEPTDTSGQGGNGGTSSNGGNTGVNGNNGNTTVNTQTSGHYYQSIPNIVPVSNASIFYGTGKYPNTPNMPTWGLR